MKLPFARISFLLLCLLLSGQLWAQTVPDKLAAAFKSLQDDPQLRNGMAALYVVDAATGQVVLDRNGKMGMAPASTQKIITSISAYELLGKDFRYQTTFAYNKANASLLIIPSGDPTFGSWRWPGTKDAAVLRALTQAIQKLGISTIREVAIANEGWNDETIPDGWMWQDVANYYGAGAGKLNWRENQYDILFKSGSRIGDPVSIVRTVPKLYGYTLQSELTSAAAGTGDNAYIYFPLNAATGTIRGTIPIKENRFKISGAFPSSAHQFVSTLADTLQTQGITMPATALVQQREVPLAQQYTPFYTAASPPLDSIVFWFNKKSINLYGEALVKTIAAEKTNSGSTEKGLEQILAFWKTKGIPEAELAMVDGSGLSPLNRVTTHAQVTLLQHAQKQPWFQGFYTSLPLYNGMKMKSGTIRGAKGFCGYHRSKDGRDYVYAIVVNNYNGSAAGVVQKMYRVLDVLK